MLRHSRELAVQVGGFVTSWGEGLIRHDLDAEMRQPQAKLVAGLQTRPLDGLTIHVSAMSRTKIASARFIAFDGQFAVATTQPAIINAQSHIHATTDGSRKLFQHYFTRGSQGILTNKA